MFTRNIKCGVCEFKGKVEAHDTINTVPASEIFKFLGKNSATGLMHFSCPSCHEHLAVDPLKVVGVKQMIGYPERTVLSGNTKTSNRHVPIIWGIGYLVFGVLILSEVNGWWAQLIGIFLLVMAVASLKTGLFGSQKEIEELTEPGPVSDETKNKFTSIAAESSGSENSRPIIPIEDFAQSLIKQIELLPALAERCKKSFNLTNTDSLLEEITIASLFSLTISVEIAFKGHPDLTEILDNMHFKSYAYLKKQIKHFEGAMFEKKLHKRYEVYRAICQESPRELPVKVAGLIISNAYDSKVENIGLFTTLAGWFGESVNINLKMVQDTSKKITFK